VSISLNPVWIPSNRQPQISLQVVNVVVIFIIVIVVIPA
jgi:hypothetical protein